MHRRYYTRLGSGAVKYYTPDTLLAVRVALSLFTRQVISRPHLFNLLPCRNLVKRLRSSNGELMPGEKTTEAFHQEERGIKVD